MEDLTSLLTNYDDFTNHQRTIIHIDMDCFYAQVEEIRNPSLRNKPMGIQQKNCVVTSNYVARDFGVQKLMSVQDALKCCPHLTLVPGEDLTPYRQMSSKIFEVLHQFSPMVEKLGLDENYIDVSDIVRERLLSDDNKNKILLKGCIYPSETKLNECKCGCAERLLIGSQIAKEMRDELYKTLHITCCAGISYNKLLAKLVGNKNKPNNQTILCSTYVENFMRELPLGKITGIGQKTEALLLENGIASIEDLQNCDFDSLQKNISLESAKRLMDLSYGRDTTAVRPTGKPKIISTEDSCRPITIRNEIEERFRLLLMRLLNQVSEDGRIPIAIKIIVRKYDPVKKSSHRESRQSNISPSLFRLLTDGEIMLVDDAQEKLLKTIMRLFDRLIDVSKSYNITLLGLAFSKFQERKIGSASIAKFFVKKSDLEVQSVLNLSSDDPKSTNLSIKPTSSNISIENQYNYRKNSPCSPVPSLMDIDSVSSDFSDFSETDIDQPSPKKSRLGLLLAKRRCLSQSENDLASPSKLKVSELNLSSKSNDINQHQQSTSFPNRIPIKSIQQNNVESMKFCNKDSEKTNINSENCVKILEKNKLSNSEKIDTIDKSQCKITCNLANVPSNVDPKIFSELPLEVQNELLESWRQSMISNNNNVGNTISTNHRNNSGPNTLYRYFIKR